MCSFHSFAIFNTNLQVFENISLSFLLKEVPFTLKWYGVRDIQAVYTNLSITGPSETFNVVQFSSPKQILRPSNRGFRKRANESSVFFCSIKSESGLSLDLEAGSLVFLDRNTTDYEVKGVVTQAQYMFHTY